MPMKRFTMPRVLLASLTGALLLTTTACSEDIPKITPEQASPYVDTWSRTLGVELKDRSSSAAAGAALKDTLQAAAAKSAEGLKRGEPPYDAFVEAVYAEREYKPEFIKSGALTERGQAILAVLDQVDTDGFDARLFGAGAIHEDIDSLESLRKDYEGLGEYTLGQAERDAAMAFVTSKTPGEFELSAENQEQVTEAVLATDAAAPMRETVERYEEISQKMAARQARIELGLARGLVRYAYKMRYHRVPEIFIHPRHDDEYNDIETRRRRPAKARADYRAGQIWREAAATAVAISKAREVDVLTDRLKDVLRDALTGDTNAVLATLSPGPQYDGLKKEYVRYREIVAQGGWQPVEVKKGLKRGKKHATVAALKERLKKEGYLAASASSDDLFDADLEDAVKAYQRTHQLDIDGEPGRVFWRSLNVSAERRTEQILWNMKRWRSSNVQHHDHEVYVTVNIPDFHAEIWKNQERQMRMRVVVGNNDTAEDEETGEEIHPNRTPLLSAYIDRVIYNPFWNVTSRIREEETLVDVRKDLEGRYMTKMYTLLGYDPKTKQKAGTTDTTITPASTTDLGTPGLAAPADGRATDAVAEPPPKPTLELGTKTKEGMRFDAATFASKYQEKYGVEANMPALFPYLSPETNIIDVSTTNPENIPPWYAANGYEVMHAGTKWEYVRQLNGDENALGRVKVIFPNLSDVYLHDTPQKALFRREIRAFSHGCMRMHEPLDFARWLLENDGQYDRREVKELLKETEYKPIFLKRRVPVHVVYFSVRADDDGRANFLSDIYKRDADQVL